MLRSLRHYLKHRAKVITPSIAWRREARKENALDDLLESTRDGHQSDHHWNRFTGNVGETSERRAGAHIGFSEHNDTILKRSETNIG